MGKALTGFSGRTSIAAATDSGILPFGPHGSNTTPNVNTEAYIGIAGTISKLSLYIDNQGTSRSLKSRKNGADGAIIVSPTNSTGGRFEDLSNSDSLAVGDTFGWRFNTSTAASVLYTFVALFEASSGHGVPFTNRPVNVTADSYAPLSGISSNATEANAQCKMKSAGTLKRLSVLANFNTAGATTVRVRKNGANGNQSVSIGASATGRFTDTTNTDTVAVDDLVNFSVTGTFGGGTLTVRNFTVFEDCTLTKNDMFACQPDLAVRAASATVHYLPLVSGIVLPTNTVEAEAEIRANYRAMLSKLRVRVAANTYSAAATLRFRKNGANGNQSVSITAGVTGWFEDTSNSDVVEETDLFDASIDGGTSGSLSISVIGSLMEPFTAVPRSQCYIN